MHSKLARIQQAIHYQAGNRLIVREQTHRGVTLLVLVSAHRESWPERLVRILTRHKTLARLVLAYLLMRVAIFFLVRQ